MPKVTKIMSLSHISEPTTKACPLLILPHGLPQGTGLTTWWEHLLRSLQNVDKADGYFPLT